MRSSIVILIVAMFATLVASAYVPAGGGCSGSDPCSACSSCKGCKHCAKQGGTCGTCTVKATKSVKTETEPDTLTINDVFGEWNGKIRTKADGEFKAKVKVYQSDEVIIVSIGAKEYSFTRSSLTFPGHSWAAKSSDGSGDYVQLTKVAGGFNGLIWNGNTIQIQLRD